MADLIVRAAGSGAFPLPPPRGNRNRTSDEDDKVTLARIYKPARTAMQSGKARTREWVLEFVSDVPREVEPLMGWTSSADTRQQIRLRFPTKEEAVAYAERNGIEYRLIEPKTPKRRPKSYAENFRWGRVGQWTH